MGIQKWSEQVVLISLAKEPQMGEELQTAIDMVVDNDSCDYVVDFTDVEVITSSSIAKMLKLRKVLIESGHHLVFCCVSDQTMNLFKIVALDSVFKYSENQFLALASLQMVQAQ